MPVVVSLFVFFEGRTIQAMVGTHLKPDISGALRFSHQPGGMRLYLQEECNEKYDGCYSTNVEGFFRDRDLIVGISKGSVESAWYKKPKTSH